MYSAQSAATSFAMPGPSSQMMYNSPHLEHAGLAHSSPALGQHASFPVASTSQAVFASSPAEWETRTPRNAPTNFASPAHPARVQMAPQPPAGRIGSHHESLLLSFIYDYLYKSGLRSSAAALLREVPDIPVQPVDEKPHRTSSMSSQKMRASSPPAGGGDAGFEEEPTVESPAKVVDAGSVTTNADSVFDKAGSRNSTPPSSTNSPVSGSIPLPAPAPTINVERGFLGEWWATFWDVYSATSGKPSTRSAQLYAAHGRQVREQQSVSQAQLGAMRQLASQGPAPGQPPPSVLRAGPATSTQGPASLQIRLPNGAIVPANSPAARALLQQQQQQQVQRAAQEQEQGRLLRLQQQQQQQQQQAAAAAQAQQMRAGTPVGNGPIRRMPSRQSFTPNQSAPGAMPQPDQQATVAAHQAAALEAHRAYRAGVAAQQQRQMSQSDLGHASPAMQQAAQMGQQAQMQVYLQTQGAPHQLQPAPMTPRGEHPAPPVPIGQPGAVSGQPTSYASSPGPMYTSAPTPRDPPPSSAPRSMKRTSTSDLVEPASKRRAAGAATPRARQTSSVAGTPARMAADSPAPASTPIAHQAPTPGPSTAPIQVPQDSQPTEDFDLAALLGAAGHGLGGAEHHGDASLFDIDQYLDFGGDAIAATAPA